MAAAFTTFVSYLAAFLIRSLDVRRLVALEMHPLKVSISLLWLMVQTVMLLSDLPHWFWIQCGMCVGMIGMYLPSLLAMARAMWEKLSPRFSRRDA